MNSTSIIFPHLGIVLPHVGKSIHLFGIEIAYYGIVIAIAMVCGVSLMLRLARKSRQDEDMYFHLVMAAIVCAIIGARIYYVIFSWENYRDDLLEIFNLRGGGLAIYGGVIGGVLTVWLYARRKRLRFPVLADTMIPGLLLGQIIGRWGNFFNREAFGGYTDSLFAMALPKSAVRQGEITARMLEHVRVIEGIDFIQVHPTFLYESLWNLAVLVLLLRYRRHKRFEGEIFLLYLCGYGIGRFWVESLRTDQLLLPVIGVPVSQVLSGMLAIGALTAIVVLRGRNGKERGKHGKAGDLKATDRE
ncbi:MAG: prolipoprotein diacylglyceryl transferase [Eubacteriales bacterium]|nr:prolipoprotein diacylglyceryl transferase [Eubacteriales bacterium]